MYHGSIGGLSTTPTWTAESNQDYARFGWSVSTAGDVNGDGFIDIIIGADQYDNGQTNEGRAFVYHGSADGLSTTPGWTAESDHDGAYFGYSVSTAGDVNGDGYGDLIVGAPNYHNGQTKVGQAYLYYGNDGGGLSLKPQQRHSDDSAPIDILGRSKSASSFRLAAVRWTPFGRGRGRLEWEVKPLGTLFDGTGTTRGSSFSDTGLTGVALNELVTGLTENTPYHWRLRLLYDPVTTPFMPHSRWLSLTYNGWQETDVRTFPCMSFGPFDFDADCDVDAADFAQFDACFTGPQIPGPPASGCTTDQFDAADRDDDGDVDQTDFAVFQRCFSGESNPAHPNCAN